MVKFRAFTVWANDSGELEEIKYSEAFSGVQDLFHCDVYNDVLGVLRERYEQAMNDCFPGRKKSKSAAEKLPPVIEKTIVVHDGKQLFFRTESDTYAFFQCRDIHRPDIGAKFEYHQRAVGNKSPDSIVWMNELPPTKRFALEMKAIDSAMGAKS